MTSPQKYITKYEFIKPRNNIYSSSISTISTQSSDEIIWEYLDEYSIPYSVSICNNGYNIGVAQGSNNERFQLFETLGSGTPNWEWVCGPNLYQDPQIDSSEQSEVLAGYTENFFHRWSNTSGIPDWTYSLDDGFDASCLCVSDDGLNMVLAVYSKTEKKSNIISFDSSTNTPIWIYPFVSTSSDPVSSWVASLDISSDSTIVAFSSSGGDVVVLDSHLKKVRWKSQGTPNAIVRISGDGSIIAIAAYPDLQNQMRVLKWIGFSYFPLWTYEISEFSDEWWISALDLSLDGSTIMIGAVYIDADHTKIAMFNTESHIPLWEYSTVSAGDYQELITEVDLSANGVRGIAAAWGDQFNTYPELKVFDRTNATPVFTVDSAGSMYSVDISPDGKFAVGGCKSCHANEMGAGGVLYAVKLPDLPNIEIADIRGGIGASAAVGNIGQSSLVDIPWKITLDGWTIFGREKTGTIPLLNLGESVTIRTAFLFGFGSATIHVMVDNITRDSNLFILGPFTFKLR